MRSRYPDFNLFMLAIVLPVVLGSASIACVAMAWLGGLEWAWITALVAGIAWVATILLRVLVDSIPTPLLFLRNSIALIGRFSVAINTVWIIILKVVIESGTIYFR